MKKHITLAALFMLFALVFTGCEKKNEWSYLHGFTTEDIVGTYSWSNIDNVFDGLLESTYCHLCDDAKITITKSVGSLVIFRFENESPAFTVAVEDGATAPGNDFMILMEEYKAGVPYEVSAHVYHDGKNRIRLHGFVREYKPGYGGPVNYYFDVIKD